MQYTIVIVFIRRVFSWSVTEQPNRGMADHWLKDEGADMCVGCHVR